MIRSCCRTFLNLSLLIFVLWTQPVGAQPASVKDINLLSLGSSPNQLVAIGNLVYFTAYTAANGHELWRSDGTALGTVLVRDIVPGCGSSGPSSLTNVNGVLYFGWIVASTGESYGGLLRRRPAMKGNLED